MSILGFCAGNTPLVLEMAYESLNIDTFDIVKNIEMDIPESLLNLHNLKIQIYKSDEYLFDSDEHEQDIHFGVVDSHIKYILYHFFFKKYGIVKSRYINITHPTSYFAGSSVTGKGLLLEPLSVVSTMSRIGFGVTIKHSCSIGHHSKIDDFVTINPGVTINGNVEIGQGATIGSGATIIHNIKIGNYSLVGAGSVVTKDIPDGVVAYGNPCRVVRKNERWNKSFEMFPIG